MASILGEIERKVEKLQAFMAQHCDQESDHSSVVEAGGTGGDWFFGIKMPTAYVTYNRALGIKIGLCGLSGRFHLILSSSSYS